MSNAPVALLQGHDYQARYFWVHASRLRHPDHPNVVEVSYEADGPKGFDDVIVRYSPGRRSNGPRRIVADHHQIKFHVTAKNTFGYEDLVRPDFTGASSVSILERLKEAKEKATPDSAFTLVTTDRITDGDQLCELQSKVENELRLDKLFVKGGDRSRMGKVRKLWRDHLGVDDVMLREVLENFRIQDGHTTLEAMRDEVNERFRVVGLITDHESMEFRFDGVAKQLKVKGINTLTRQSFEELCVDEKWIRVGEPDQVVTSVAVRSFSDGAVADLDATADRTLSLLPQFEGRRLRDGADWNRDVLPEVKAFFEGLKGLDGHVRLSLNAHASLAFLAGDILGFKSGVPVEIVQRGRTGPSVWRADDGKSGPPLDIVVRQVSHGADLALAVSLTRDSLADVQDYVATSLPEVGNIMDARPRAGPGQAAVAGGKHAAAMADQIAEAVRAARLKVGAKVHVFVSGPNAFSFFLGQQRPAMGTCVTYEFDFERRLDASYLPAFRID
ncbi:MAG TPA: SAVED domain-containing protein [Sphingomonadaceae bacterium]|nr:SAVED domain-containing protein [Sphingomonadaceae bacterium]